MTITGNSTIRAAMGPLAMSVMVLSLLANATPSLYAQSGSDPQHRVSIDFNRWHDYDELKADLLRLEDA